MATDPSGQTLTKPAAAVPAWISNSGSNIGNFATGDHETRAASAASDATANRAVATTSAGAGPLKAHPHNETSDPAFATKSNGHTGLPDSTQTSSPRTATRTTTPTALPGLDVEPEPAKIISDILPPSLPHPETPTYHTMPVPPKSAAASGSARKTKYATDEERRATSIALRGMSLPSLL